MKLRITDEKYPFNILFWRTFNIHFYFSTYIFSIYSSIYFKLNSAFINIIEQSKILLRVYYKFIWFICYFYVFKKVACFSI
jgi:hypothetical protein